MSVFDGVHRPDRRASHDVALDLLGLTAGEREAVYQEVVALVKADRRSKAVYNSLGVSARMKVRDLLRRLKADGWYVARTRGSHRVLKHPAKKGIVVVAGHPSKELAPGTLRSIWKQAELEE